MKQLIIAILAGAVSVGAIAKPPKDKDDNKALPPGLEKKMATQGTLPPGWQKKLKKGSILDIQVYKSGKVVQKRDRNGHVVVTIDGRVIRLIEATREIVDILK